jgi:raffinose/stachyose/melibiose transport system substrate-binding protein
MKKFIISLLTLVFVVSMICVGCKTAETTIGETTAADTTATAGATTAVETAATAEKPTLTFWVNPTITDAWKNLYAGFEAASGYKLDMQMIPMPFEEPILTKWAAGERPDILSFHMSNNWLSQLNPKENLIDLSDLEFATKTKYNFLDSYKPTGGIWGPVIGYPGLGGIVYNKEIFAANNLEIPGNFDELFELCGKLKALGITPLYAGVQDAWPVQLDVMCLSIDAIKADPNWWNDINSGKTTFVQPAIVDAITAVKKLIDAGYYQKDFLVGTYEGQKAVFEGDAAMVFTGDWLPTVWVENYGLDEVNKKVGAFGMSMNSNTVANMGLTSPDASYFVCKTGNADKEAGAKEFIKYITGEGKYHDAYQNFLNEYQKPSCIEGFTDPKFTVGPYIDFVNYASKSIYPQFQNNLLVHYGPFEIYMQELFAGTKTPEEVAQALTDEFTKNAKTAGLAGF